MNEKRLKAIIKKKKAKRKATAGAENSNLSKKLNEIFRGKTND